MKLTQKECDLLAGIISNEVPEITDDRVRRIVVTIVDMVNAQDDLAKKAVHPAKDTHVRLETPAQVMRAFLSGHKLINSNYYDAEGEFYLYLSESGQICEEDGAGAKESRVPICNRDWDSWWAILNKNITSERITD